MEIDEKELTKVKEKARKWDTYQAELVKEKAHTERFISLIDAEEDELRADAAKWRKVEEIAHADDCVLCPKFQQCQDSIDSGDVAPCPFEVVLYALTEKEPT